MTPLVQEAIIAILKERPDIASKCMKLAINKLISNGLRTQAWKALLGNNSDAIGHNDWTNKNHKYSDVFDILLAFVNSYPNLGFVVTNFEMLKELEMLVKDCHLEVTHAISIAIPLVYCMKNDLIASDESRMNRMFKLLISHLPNDLKKENIIPQARKIHRLLEIYNNELSQQLELDKITELLELFFSVVFVGVLNFDVTLFIFDQLIMCSAEVNRDISLPSLRTWYCWISAALIISSKEYLTGVITDNNYFSTITSKQLSRHLEPFVTSPRDGMMLSIYPTDYSTDIDDVVSVNEQDIIVRSLPIYDQEVYLWNKKRNAQRKGRIQLLMRKWRLMSKGIVTWIVYFGLARKNIFEKKQKRREEMLTNVKKHEIVVHISAPPSPVEKKAIIEPVKKIGSNIFTVLSNGKLALSPAGLLFEEISNHTTYLFGCVEGQKDWTVEQDHITEEKSIFFEKDEDGQIILNHAGTIINELLKSAGYIFSGAN